MLGIDKLLQKLLNRQKQNKSQRKDFEEEFDIKSKYIHGMLFYNSYFDYLMKALDKETVCLIVGGWIRDRLLNRPLGKNIDIDFIITTDPLKVAKKLKNILGKGSIFQFEKEKNVVSFIFYEGDYKYRFDFSYLDISDIMSNSNLDFYDKEREIIKRIDEDLLQRDFTINAMAIVFDDAVGLGATQTVLFDPSGGLEDLQRGLLRPVSIENIQKDPVRILRGFRIAGQLDLDIDKEFLDWVKDNRELLDKSPKERIRDEILKIFDSKEAEKTVKTLVDYKVFQYIVPEIEEMIKIKNSENISSDTLLSHSLKTLSYIEDFLKKKEFLADFIDREFLKALGKRKFLTEFTDITLFKLFVFFHCIGKIKKENGDTEGVKIFKERIANRLILGSRASQFIANLMEKQSEVLKLFDLWKMGKLTDKNKNFFWYKNKDIAVYLFIFSLAKLCSLHNKECFKFSKKVSKNYKSEIERLKEFVKSLQEYYFNVYKKEIVETPLLNGKEIMEILNLSSGKKIGEIKSKLLEYQISGLIKSKKEAIRFIKSFNIEK